MRNNALCDSGAGEKGRSGRAEARMEGSMKLPTGQARTGDDVRSERIMAGFRMSAVGPCRDAGLPEAAKTDEPVAHGCAAVASALGVRIGRQPGGGWDCRITLEMADRERSPETTSRAADRHGPQ